VVSQIASEQQIHHQVQIHLVLERILHVDDEFALNHRQKFEFIHDARNAFFCDDPRLSHFLHRVLLVFVLFRLHSPNFAESASAHGVNLGEVGFAGQRRTLLVLACLKIAVAHSCWSSSRSVCFASLYFYLFKF